MRRDERGFALVAVLLVLAVVGSLGAEFAYSTRLEATAVRTWKENIIAGHLAEAAVDAAVREIVAAQAAGAQDVVVAMDEDGLLTFYTRANPTATSFVARPRQPRERVALGPGHYSYRITDESARLNVNVASPVSLDRLLQELGLDKSDRDVIVDSIQDWMDGNEEYRANGAESEDYYLKLSVPYRARNGFLESVSELLQIRGVTPALFRGPGERRADERAAAERGSAARAGSDRPGERAAGERPGLADLVTVAGGQGQARVNINTASRFVLAALGLADAQILEIESTRRLTPYAQSAISRFGVTGSTPLSTATRTFRIEAQGLMEGRVRARLTAVVQATQSEGAPVRIFEWSGVR